MQLLGDFGFEPILFAAQIVNFLIIFFVLKKFLYKPMIKMLDERKHKIAEGLKHAEESEKRLQETIEKEEKILRKANEEARKLIEQAKAQQTEIMRNTEERTREQVDAMLKEARAQIAFESAQTEKRLTNQVSKLAVEFLEQSLHGLLGEKEQEMVMKNAMKKLKEKRAD